MPCSMTRAPELLALFAFDAMPLGAAVFASEIYATLQGATGVVAADVDVFQLKHYQDLTAIEQAVRAVDAGPLQPHIRIFPARPTPPLALIDRFRPSRLRRRRRRRCWPPNRPTSRSRPPTSS